MGKEHDGSWSITIDVGEVVANVNWDDLMPLLLGGIYKKIYENDINVDLSKYSKEELAELEKLHPKYFKQIKEKHGQTKMFESTNKALQYLSDLLGKTIRIEK